MQSVRRVARARAAAAAILTAAVTGGGCGDSDVDGLGALDRFDVGILVVDESGGRAGWPDGDVARVSLARDGTPVHGAIVTVNGAALADRGDYYEPPTPLDLEPLDTLAFAVRLPGFTRRDTVFVTEPPRILGPPENADLRGCGAIEVEWSRFAGASGAWVAIDGDAGEEAVFASRDPQASAAIVSVPHLDASGARVRVLALATPLDAFRPDAPPPALVPAGVHVLAWSAPRRVLLDPGNPLETFEPESLSVRFEAGDTVRIAWTPDTVRVRRLTISTQFFAEGNLRWEIDSPGGFLPPVAFGRVPDGARACVPLERAPAPMEPGVEYLIEAAGARHTGRGRGVPIR